MANSPMDSKKLGPCSTDAISLLPDEILGNILSSLPTVQAASTSVLSKKWRNVFRLVNNLDFDDSVWGEYKLEMYGFPESFKNFVDRTLALQCDYPIKKVSLKCHVGTEYDTQKACVTNWIYNVLQRGVLELDLCIKEDMGLRSIPLHHLFASKTLVKLTLGTRLCLGKLPSDVSLPSLKTLFIDTVFFEDDDLCVLLAGCTVLEELSIHHDNFSAITQTISSPTIKRLSVNYEYSCSSMSFDLPKLVYLVYSHFVLLKYPQVNLESLVEAKLDLYTMPKLSPDLTDLIMGIRNVKILHLSPNSVHAIYCYCRSELLVFNNLVKLSVGIIRYKKDWKLLACLLKQSPKLETLIIQNLYGDICGDVFMNLNKVKVLHILSYQGTDEELRHLKSFLWKTKCIEVVQVDVTAEDDCITLQTKRHLMKRIGVSLPSNCQIKVSHK